MISILNNLSQQIKTPAMLKVLDCDSGEYINKTYKYNINVKYISVGTIIRFEILQREDEGKDIFTCNWYIDKGYCSQFLSEILNKLSDSLVVVLGVINND